jgi:hypothetical protein
LPEINTEAVARQVRGFVEDRPGIRLYALLDAARDPAVLELLDRPGRRSLCLLGDGLPPRVERSAPHLLRLDPDGGALAELLERGWGRRWGALLTSRWQTRELCWHLRRQAVSLVPGGRLRLVRFYDPGVLPGYLERGDPARTGALFGGVRQILAEIHGGHGVAAFFRKGPLLFRKDLLLADDPAAHSPPDESSADALSGLTALERRLEATDGALRAKLDRGRRGLPEALRERQQARAALSDELQGLESERLDPLLREQRRAREERQQAADRAAELERQQQHAVEELGRLSMAVYRAGAELKQRRARQGGPEDPDRGPAGQRLERLRAEREAAGARHRGLQEQQREAWRRRREAEERGQRLAAEVKQLSAQRDELDARLQDLERLEERAQRVLEQIRQQPQTPPPAPAHPGGLQDALRKARQGAGLRDEARARLDRRRQRLADLVAAFNRLPALELGKPAAKDPHPALLDQWREARHELDQQLSLVGDLEQRLRDHHRRLEQEAAAHCVELEAGLAHRERLLAELEWALKALKLDTGERGGGGGADNHAPHWRSP